MAQAMSVEMQNTGKLEKKENVCSAKSEDVSNENILNKSPEDKKAITTKNASKTTGSMMGEAIWLMSQSPVHKHLSLADLEWLLMPPVILEQYKIYRDANAKPVAAALWGYLNEDAEKRLKGAGRLSPHDWGNNAAIDQDRGLVAHPGGTLWLVELITPFHTKENKHREQTLADLANSAFKNKTVKMLHINPETMVREEITFHGNSERDDAKK